MSSGTSQYYWSIESMLDTNSFESIIDLMNIGGEGLTRGSSSIETLCWNDSSSCDFAVSSSSIGSKRLSG